MTRDTNDADWSSTLSMGSNYASNKFPLAYKNFNEVSSLPIKKYIFHQTLMNMTRLS